MLAGLVVAGLACSDADAATTIGSSLAGTPVAADACPFSGDACTSVTNRFPGITTQSPLPGVVVRWRVRANPQGIPVGIRLKILNPILASTSTSATRVVNGGSDQVFTFDTRQPISTGETIALDLDGPNGSLAIRTAENTPGSHRCWWDPLPDGEAPHNLSCFEGQGELLYNADVEPDADCDGFGDETQDPLVSGGCFRPRPAILLTKSAKTKGKRIRLSFLCGRGSSCDAAVNLSVRRSSGELHRHARIGSGHVAINGGTTGTAIIRLTKRARRVLRAIGALRANVTVQSSAGTTMSPLRIELIRRKD
jgi:hypothetical protein